MWACCRWHVTGGLADFVSLPELLSDRMSVRDISVRVSVWACQDLLRLHLCVCTVHVNTASLLFVPLNETVEQFEVCACGVKKKEHFMPLIVSVIETYPIPIATEALNGYFLSSVFPSQRVKFDLISRHHKLFVTLS